MTLWSDGYFSSKLSKLKNPFVFFNAAFILCFELKPYPRVLNNHIYRAIFLKLLCILHNFFFFPNMALKLISVLPFFHLNPLYFVPHWGTLVIFV